MGNEPAPQSVPSDINEAFEALRREASLTRHAVEGLTAARERVPDYSTPLGQIIDTLKRAPASLDRIEKSPAVQLTPDAPLAAPEVEAEAHALSSQALIVGPCHEL